MRMEKTRRVFTSLSIVIALILLAANCVLSHESEDEQAINPSDSEQEWQFDSYFTDFNIKDPIQELMDNRSWLEFESHEFDFDGDGITERLTL